MIDLQKENVMSLSAACKALPRRRQGKRPHVATLYRWVSTGMRGVKLETIQVGGTMCTSTEALQRFCNRLSGEEVAAEPSARRRTQIARAEAELDAGGVG